MFSADEKRKNEVFYQSALKLAKSKIRLVPHLFVFCLFVPGSKLARSKFQTVDKPAFGSSRKRVCCVGVEKIGKEVQNEVK